MENSVTDFLQLGESFDSAQKLKTKSNYVSFIKINGKPILPPVIDGERRKELQKFKQKAIELELKLSKQKTKNLPKVNQISSEVSSIDNVPPSRQSTPARPATLNLNEKGIGKTFVLAKSKTEGSIDKYKDDEDLSSQYPKNLNKPFRSSLEHRLASEDGVFSRNKSNICQQSPITEENLPEKDSDHESSKEKKIWSPLHTESIHSLKIELPTKDNVEVSLDEKTPETVTHSPHLMRQNSYTLLTPSPALLQFLETQKDENSIPRSQSGRKTWDLTTAKKNWDPNLAKSSDEEDAGFFNRKNSSSLDSLSFRQTKNNHSFPNSFAYDSGTSPESCHSKKTAPKVKHKLKGKKIRSVKSVPLSNATDKVPYRSSQRELPDLSDLLLKMKVDFERQKRELEEKQMSEMKKLEIIFQRKEAELLSKVSQAPKKSIYTQRRKNSWTEEMEERSFGVSGVSGDGDHGGVDRRGNHTSEISQRHGRRPHSAKGFPQELYCYESECNRRTRSMDFNQNMDTDLDVSFQDDYMNSKDTTMNNEYVLDSDSMSNFSSNSSTVSSDNRGVLGYTCTPKKFQGMTSEEYARYNQAAMKITAAARGFLTRRLLRTSHVQGLITTLRDAINCATQLHAASDIADSDIELMRRLGRQIEAAWDAVYAVFFNTGTTAKLQLIATDRERLRAAMTKTPGGETTGKKKRISAATRKSLDRKKLSNSIMSKSTSSNGCTRIVRTCTKMAASYPSPYFPQKLK